MKTPEIHESVFVAPTATVVGNVRIGAGALIPQNAVIPDGSLVVGMPGKVRRAVTEEEIATNRASAVMYMEEAAEYKEMYEAK